MQIHDVANIFPHMSANELKELTADIAANGLREPIWTWNGQIIDGRNRYKACQKAGVEPIFREWNGDKKDLVSFVISVNLHRRHLSESQRAMVAARLVNLTGPGRPLKNQTGGVIISQDQAAQAVNVSTRSVSRAVNVLKNTVGTVIAKVESGEMTVAEATRYSSIPRAKQMKMISQGRSSIKKLTTGLRAEVLSNEANCPATCLIHGKDAEFTAQNITAALDLLIYQADRYFKQHGGTNYTGIFRDVQMEMLEEGLRTTIEGAVEKVLAVIDEFGIIEKEEARQITKLDRAEFSAALTHLLDYQTIEMVKDEVKQDAARGARKDLLRRISISESSSDPDTSY